MLFQRAVLQRLVDSGCEMASLYEPYRNKDTFSKRPAGVTVDIIAKPYCALVFVRVRQSVHGFAARSIVAASALLIRPAGSAL